MPFPPNSRLEDLLRDQPDQVVTIAPDGDPVNHPEVVKLPGRGSGVIIGPNLVLSAAHVLVSGVEIHAGPNDKLVGMGTVVRILEANVAFDLAVGEVSWSGKAPRCIMPSRTSINIDDGARLVGCGNPNKSLRGGATGHVLHARCVPGDPAEMARWGAFHEETWIAQLTKGHICHLDSGGAAYSLASGEQVLIGIISGPVTGEQKEPIKVAGELCSDRERVILLNDRTVTWIETVAGNRLCGVA